jgi:hypothetical protein
MERKYQLASFSRLDRERQHLRLEMKGRPLTRDEEYRIIAQATALRGIRPSADRFANLTAVQEFTALFVIGMLGGIAAVFIALIVL